ncbi:MAG: hypothetical protein KGJ95_03190 [Candidatus Omnitrophica bacterium]|nr:hypothetical protein [Candidatus Omnitrophota bacterium]
MILYEEVLREFQRQKVKYVVVGGIAINLHGFLRYTSDLDILVDLTDSNLKKIVTILKKMGYRVKQPVDLIGTADGKIRYDWIKNKNMKAFNFYKDGEYKEVDVIIESPVPFKEADQNALHLKIDDVKIPVISLDDLIKMKRKAAREIDQRDLEQLGIIRKIRPKRRTKPGL